MLLDFLEGTTTSIAGTLGDGAVTLSRLAGGSVDAASLILPNDTWFGSTKAVEVEYVIEDIRTNSASIKFECGFGTVTNNVLTRVKPRTTINNTTVSDNAPSALQFGSSPTAGNVRVRISPLSDSFVPTPPAIQTTLGSDTYKGYQVSAHFVTSESPSIGGALGNTKEYYVPFLNLIRGAIGGVGVDIGTAGTGGNNIKLGLYGVGSDGLPGNCITQFNQISVAATGFIVDTTPGTWAVRTGPLRVRPGWYYMGMMTNDAAVALRTWARNGAGQRVLYPPLGRGSSYGFGENLSKTADNSFATGLPTGVPNSGTNPYTLNMSGPDNPVCALKITN